MPARNVAGGTALAGSLTVNATISAGVVVHQGSVAFAGAGNLIANSIQRLNSTTAFAGTGSFVTNAALIQPATAAFAGAGALAADGSTAKQPTAGSAAFAGAGSLTASAAHFSAGVYDETGATTLTIAANAFSELEFGLKLDDTLQTGDVLNFRVYLDGQPLATYSVTPSITVAAHAISATTAWAGVGNLLVDATVGVLAQEWQGSAAFPGAGQFVITPQLLAQAQAVFAGAGSMTVELAKYTNLLQGTAAFAGAGNLIAATNKLLLATSASFAGVGLQTVDATRTINLLAESLAGVGSLTAASRMRIATAADFDGSGAFAIAPVLRMRAFANFAGAGAMYANLTPPIMAWPAEAQFDGSGDLFVRGSFYIPAAVQMDGVGNFTADAMRFIPLSETFSGAGSFLIGDVQQLLAALANYGAVGSLTVSTTITSARAEWLVCASISIAPELPVAVTLNPEMAADPSMKVC